MGRNGEKVLGVIYLSHRCVHPLKLSDTLQHQFPTKGEGDVKNLKILTPLTGCMLFSARRRLP